MTSSTSPKIVTRLNPSVESFFDTVVDRASEDGVTLTHQGKDVGITNCSKQDLENLDWPAVMLTVASSDFRMNVILHYPHHSDMANTLNFFGTTRPDSLSDYSDHVCETGNNICGAICRVLSAQGLSTGLSTPATIENKFVIKHMNFLNAHYERHLVVSCIRNYVLYISAVAFFRDNFEADGRYKLSATLEQSETGELEFF